MEPGQAVVLIRGFMDKKLSSGCRVWPSKRPGFFCLDVMSGTGFKLLQSSKADLVAPPTRLQGSKSSRGGASSDKTKPRLYESFNIKPSGGVYG